MDFVRVRRIALEVLVCANVFYGMVFIDLKTIYSSVLGFGVSSGFGIFAFNV